MGSGKGNCGYVIVICGIGASHVERIMSNEENYKNIFAYFNQNIEAIMETTRKIANFLFS